MLHHSKTKSHKDSYHRILKVSSKKQQSFRTSSPKDRPREAPRKTTTSSPPSSPWKKLDSPPTSRLSSMRVYALVGHKQRQFLFHEAALCLSPYFERLCKEGHGFTPMGVKVISLPEEEPEVFSAVLEYVYEGDYSPKLDVVRKMSSPETNASVYYHRCSSLVLKDTAVYCAAEKYGFPELKQIALKKQGLQSGVQCSTLLSSARFAYANTPDTDSNLRAHYLALIIRTRGTFKRSGTLQMEMEQGGKMFFDLFVAMVNHLDDVTSLVSPHKVF